MKKTLLAMLLALSALFALSACAAGGSGSDLKASMTMDELADDIMGKVEFAMTNRVDLDDPDELEYFKERTGLDTEWLADHSFNTNMMVTADNLLLAEGKTADDAAKIAEAFEAYRKDVEQSFERYLPEPYEMAQQGKVVTKGRYVMLVISEDNGTAVETFEGAIQ